MNEQSNNHSKPNNPQGYSEETANAQLQFEDIDDDSELWLIRVPNDVDPAELENKEFDLYSKPTVLEVNDGTQFDCTYENCEMPQLCLILPKADTHELMPVEKTFKGSVLITPSVTAMNIALEKMEVANDCPVEHMPNSKTSKKHKKKHRESDVPKVESSSDLDDINMWHSQTK